jgi:TonB family protein
MLTVALALLTTRITMSDALVRNPRFCSPNGQYCLIVREYSNLPDFATAKAKVLVSENSPKERRATLYTQKTRVARTLVPRPYRTILVSNDGKFVVVREPVRPIVAGTPLLDVFTRGSMHTLNAGDLFAPTDFDAINREPFSFETRLDGAQVVVMNAVRVSLATARRVEPLRDLYPSPRTWVTASRQMLARAVERPLPVYPAVAWKARISGATTIEVVVSEQGRVLSSRVMRPFPFGIDAAAQEAARRWTFTPQQAEWQGMLEFHFGLLTEDECRKVQCDGSR